MRMGRMITAMLASTLGMAGGTSLSVYDGIETMSLLSSSSSDSGRTHSSGTRARRQWKRRRAAGITKRVRA